MSSHHLRIDFFVILQVRKALESDNRIEVIIYGMGFNDRPGDAFKERLARLHALGVVQFFLIPDDLHGNRADEVIFVSSHHLCLLCMFVHCQVIEEMERLGVCRVTAPWAALGEGAGCWAQSDTPQLQKWADSYHLNSRVQLLCVVSPFVRFCIVSPFAQGCQIFAEAMGNTVAQLAHCRTALVVVDSSLTAHDYSGTGLCVHEYGMSCVRLSFVQSARSSGGSEAHEPAAWAPVYSIYDSHRLLAWHFRFYQIPLFQTHRLRCFT